MSFVIRTGCPECDAQASAEEWGYAYSTDGPVRMVRVTCVDGHSFLGPADTLLGKDKSHAEPDAA